MRITAKLCSKKKSLKVAMALMGPLYVVVEISRNDATDVSLFTDKDEAIKVARAYCKSIQYRNDRDDVMVFAVDVDDKENYGEKVWDAWEEYK